MAVSENASSEAGLRGRGEFACCPRALRRMGRSSGLIRDLVEVGYGVATRPRIKSGVT